MRSFCIMASAIKLDDAKDEVKQHIKEQTEMWFNVSLYGWKNATAVHKAQASSLAGIAAPPIVPNITVKVNAPKMTAKSPARGSRGNGKPYRRREYTNRSYFLGKIATNRTNEYNRRAFYPEYVRPSYPS